MFPKAKSLVDRLSRFWSAIESHSDSLGSSMELLPHSRRWRILSVNPETDWSWNVNYVAFLERQKGQYVRLNGRAISSGSALSDEGNPIESYGAHCAFQVSGGFWGGRRDSQSLLWIGIELPEPANVAIVHLQQVGKPHSCSVVHAQYEDADGTWRTNASFEGISDEHRLEKLKLLKAAQPPQLFETGAHRGLGRNTACLPALKDSTSWRIYTPETLSGWAWDILRVKFYGHNDAELKVFESIIFSDGVRDDKGQILEDYKPENAMEEGHYGFFGARADADGIWIGIRLHKPTQVSYVVLKQCAPPHFTEVLHIQYMQDGEWATIASFKDIKNEDNEFRIDSPTAPLEYRLSGVADGLTSLPSQACPRHLLPTICKVEKVFHRPALNLPFVPAATFYDAVNCEGLWVCSSKSVGKEVLNTAASFIRAWIPLPLRKLFAEFRSPQHSHCNDPGPMRVIILDNRTNQQAGCIPELQNEATGRNGTMCPFIFTSREDFVEGVSTWRVGALTAHEIVHGADMVIRQLVDPYFHVLVQKLYQDNQLKRVFDKKLYAASNRDEYLAESHVIALGIASQPYIDIGFRNASDLEKRDAEIVELLKRFLMGKTVKQIESVDDYINYCKDSGRISSDSFDTKAMQILHDHERKHCLRQ